ncbi:hypothetical protein [Salibacterium lacus]|uniref:DUF1573 domain-containing protein n=1 Tax=Salibacterium lacus TaxID=1898109 RepID=A0ABW5SY71_9BACI
MAQLSVQKLSLSGISPSFTAAASGGDTFKNYGKTILHVKNDGSSEVTVTVASNPCEYGENHDVEVSIPAGEERQIGNFDQNRFNDDGYLVSVSYSSVSSVTVAAIQY